MTMPDKPMVDNGPAMPDNLPALLQRAAQALPERFRDAPLPWLDYTYPHTLQAFLRGDWELIWADGSGQEWPQHWDLMLEAACREEIEERGWTWTTKSGEGAGRYTARVYIGVKGHADVRHGYAPTPAQALLSALLSALAQHEAQA